MGRGGFRGWLSTRRGNARAHLRDRGESGVGLIEVVIAGALLVAMLTAIGSTLETASSATGNATDKVMASGIARQYLSSWVEQLDSDDVSDFPAPFTMCAASGSDSDTPLCQRRGTAESSPVVFTASCQSPDAGAGTGNPPCTAPEESGGAGIGNHVAYLHYPYVVTTTAQWACEEPAVGAPVSGPGTLPGVTYDQGANGNSVPVFEIQVQVTWQGMVGSPGVVAAVTVPAPAGISTSSPPPDPSLGISNTGNTPPCP